MVAEDPKQSALYFKRWKFLSELSPSAVFSLQNACGIYVLEFEGGEQYVGQSVNFPSRLTSHRRHYPDIVAVNFAQVPRAVLNQAEYDEIQKRRAAGITLRNKTLMAQPLGDSPLDAIVDRQVQHDWLFPGASEDTDEIVYGDRAQVARRRAHSREAFERLTQNQFYEEVLDSLACYVADVIPWSHETEGRTWTVSALPSTNRRKDTHRLATLSVNNVEMLFIGEDLDGGEWCPWTVLNIAGDARLPPDIAQDAQFGDFYRSAGRTGSLAYDGFPLMDLLQVPEVLLAARSLALAQLRKGATMFARFHNDALADAIYLRIDDMMEPVSGDLMRAHSVGMGTGCASGPGPDRGRK